jgi:Response regulator of the LytR/AlgR family
LIKDRGDILNIKNNKICIKTINGTLLLIDRNEIINFEKSRNYVKINILRFTKEDIYVHCSIKKIDTFLDKYNLTEIFYKSHYSFIININHIKYINQKSVIMTNGIKIPISNRYKNNLMKCIKDKSIELIY